MCFFCCSSFVDCSKLRQHTIEEHCEAKLDNVLRNMRGFGNRKIKLDVSELHCKRCSMSMRSFHEFLDHLIKTHNDIFEKELVQFFLPFKLSDEGMSCNYCGLHFKFFGTLLTHTHSCRDRPKTFICEACGEGFICKTKLISHLKIKHSGMQRHCSKCKIAFPTLQALNKHYEKTHRPKDYKCPQCPEVLKSYYLRKRHLALVHEKDRQFECVQCDLVFTKKSALVQHVSRVHLKEKSIACDICGFKGFNKGVLKLHMAKHDDSKPFRCEYCKKCLRTKKSLDFHTRIHTNDKRYVCKDCGKSFVQATSLKLHVKVHHSVRSEIMVNK